MGQVGWWQIQLSERSSSSYVDGPRGGLLELHSFGALHAESEVHRLLPRCSCLIVEMKAVKKMGKKYKIQNM